MLTALGLLAVAALIAANGWFVAAEFSFVAARRNRIEALAAEGNPRARAAQFILTRLSFMLSGAQLGITVTSLVVGFIAEGTIGAALRPLVDAVGVPASAASAVSLSAGFILATATQMVFGELAPKNLAIARPEPVALSLARSVRLFLRVSAPIIALFDGAANRLLRALGIEPVEEIHAGVGTDELAAIIHESKREGDLTDRQAALLARILEFRDLRASAVMVPRNQMVTVGSHATCEELRQLAVRTGLSRFPVVGEDVDDVRGVVTAKTVFGVPLADRPVRRVGDVAADALVVPESATLATVLADFRARQTHLGVVVDEHGGTAGLVTLEDLVEEIVGEIRDEHDRPEPRASSLPDGSYRLPGVWRLDETARDTGVHLPEGDYDTLSGLVMAELGRLPEVGDEVHLDAAILRVERLSGHAVERLRLMPRPDASAEDGARS